MNADRLVAEVSARQGGAIRLDQALDCGLSRAQVKNRLATGQWSSLAKGCYLVAEMTNLHDRLRAAITALPGAVVSHEAAAGLHGLNYVNGGVASVLVHSQATHRFTSVVVRRCHDLEEEHVEQLEGLPRTTVPRTIVDLAGVLTEKNTAAVLDDAVSARLTTIVAVQVVLTMVGRRGRPGTANLRRILEARADLPVHGSPLERLGNQILLDGRFPEPQLEYSIPWDPPRRFDAAFPDHRLAVEWDSRRWHTQPAAFDRDRDRDRQAIVNGWRVLRFTWSDVTETPEKVARYVLDALAQSPVSA